MSITRLKTMEWRWQSNGLAHVTTPPANYAKGRIITGMLTGGTEANHELQPQPLTQSRPNRGSGRNDF